MENSAKLFKNILVPADGSQLSIVAGRLAVGLASATNARITLVYIIDDKVVSEIVSMYKKPKSQVVEEMRLKGLQYLEYIAQIARLSDLETEQVVLTGVPYVEIESLVRNHDIDLVVMGQIKDKNSRGFLIGSTTQRVIENVRCPVLVAK